jgi:hypothetical protein
MRGVVAGDLVTEVRADLPDDDARDELMELLERVRDRPDAFPGIRDPDAVISRISTRRSKRGP